MKVILYFIAMLVFTYIVRRDQEKAEGEDNSTP